VLVAQETKPLTNEDVVKLSKAGLGDDVVIAKINQAPQVDFKLDTDSLIALKQQGVSKAVIEAMLKKATAPAAGGPNPAPPTSTNPLAARAGAPASASSQPQDEEGVILRTADKTITLQSVQGDLSTVYAFAVYLLYLDFPGLQAEVRIADRRPTIVVRSKKSPRGRLFLVRAEQDKNDNVRSVKVGKAGMFGAKSWNSPDPDWVVACDVKDLGNGTWELVPKGDLAPGEYGVLFRGGITGTLGESAELYDFGVE
jgi:hypothetical protein